jgi:quercetin dioxygenase-like cupin family protein
MKTTATAIIGFLLVAASLSIAADNDAGFIRMTPEQVPFKTASGFEQAILFGDPAKPGIYVLRVRFPPGVHSNPHFHSQDRHVTVIKGVWWMGVGETIDPGKAVPLRAGSYALHPAGAVHWDGARDEETIVQIVGMGPVQTVQSDPKKEPFSTWTAPKNAN